MTQHEGLKHLEAVLYEDWKRNARHWEEYGSEFLGTAFLVFCVVGVVAWMFGASSPVPPVFGSHALRLLLTGLLLGGAIWLFAVSPPGRLSGAHLNPAISLGFWLLGKMHGRDVVGYVLGQMAGGVVGAFLGKAAFGSLAREVQAAALVPSPQVGRYGVLWAEMGATFALALAVYTFVSHKSLLRWTPAMVTVLLSLLICVDGSYSGAGMNPARWLGPALVTQTWTYGAMYLLAPLVGALGASGLRRWGVVALSLPHTGKLFHDARYRSLFRHDKAASYPPEAVRQEARRAATSPE